MATATKQRGATRGQLAVRAARAAQVREALGLGDSTAQEQHDAKRARLERLIAEVDLALANRNADLELARLGHFLGVSL